MVDRADPRLIMWIIIYSFSFIYPSTAMYCYLFLLLKTRKQSTEFAVAVREGELGRGRGRVQAFRVLNFHFIFHLMGCSGSESVLFSVRELFFLLFLLFVIIIYCPFLVYIFVTSPSLSLPRLWSLYLKIYICKLIKIIIFLIYF